MSSAIVPLAIISIAIINYPLWKTVIKFQDKKYIGQECSMNTLRGDVCLESKEEICPRKPSYKQCTNNNMPLSKCQCNNPGFELCPKNLQYNEKCFMKKYRQMPDLTIYPSFPKSHTRVNIRRCDNTGYNHNTPLSKVKPIQYKENDTKSNYLDRNHLYSQHPQC
tara:strand:- start:2445 stop:2939 length:495 start_codon:yes stop_codon:yes gene_type:complete